MNRAIQRLVCALCLMTGLLFAGPVAAQTTSPEPAAESEAVSEEVDLLGRIEGLKAQVDKLKGELRGAEGEDRVVALTQIMTRERELRELLADLVALVAEPPGEGASSQALNAKAQTLVKEQAEVVRDELAAIQDRMAELRTQRDQAATGERAPIELKLGNQDELLAALMQDLFNLGGWKEQLGLDPQSDLDYLDKVLQERAEKLAGRMELTLEELKTQQERLSKAAEADKEAIQLELAAFELRRDRLKEALAATVDLMRQRKLDATVYSQLLIQATGEITGDIFDTKVAFGLVQQWLEVGRKHLVENGPGWIFKLIVFVLILLVFKLLANVAGRLVRRAVSTSKLSISVLLQEFFVTLASKAVLVLGVLVALSQLGIQLGPLLAGLGVAGFIIGFALQDTLSNFASGMMILVYRPYDVGDVVEAGGVMGKVKQMSLVSTTILTFDNQKLVVPNNKIWGDVIRNVTAEGTRRVDLVFGISYQDDIAHAERVLWEIVNAHELVLTEPAPVIRLHTLGESSVDFVVRPWVATAEYWTVYWDITRAVKERFDAEGISIPFPQRDVHLFQQPATA
jgi:small conductance mechanosensitive channel